MNKTPKWCQDTSRSIYILRLIWLNEKFGSIKTRVSFTFGNNRILFVILKIFHFLGSILIRFSTKKWYFCHFDILLMNLNCRKPLDWIKDMITNSKFQLPFCVLSRLEFHCGSDSELLILHSNQHSMVCWLFQRCSCSRKIVRR